MITVSLVAMFAVMGLAVDLGWMFYVKRTAQSAADAAALAAARGALITVGQAASFTCGVNVDCSTNAVTCSGSFSNNLTMASGGACWSAAQNGFSPGGSSGRQNVTFAGNVVTNPLGCAPNCIPTAPGVVPVYWATARVTENVPQLFSSVIGRMTGTVAARATGGRNGHQRRRLAHPAQSRK